MSLSPLDVSPSYGSRHPPSYFGHNTRRQCPSIARIIPKHHLNSGIDLSCLYSKTRSKHVCSVLNSLFTCLVFWDIQSGCFAMRNRPSITMILGTHGGYNSSKWVVFTHQEQVSGGQKKHLKIPSVADHRAIKSCRQAVLLIVVYPGLLIFQHHARRL